MENDNSLMPDVAKSISREYKDSLRLIFKNKWLVWTSLFFVFTQIVSQNSTQIYQRAFFKDLYSYKAMENSLAVQPNFSEKIAHAFSLLHLYNLLSSLSFLGFLNLLGVAIVFFIFYKKFSALSKYPAAKKISSYSATIFILGLVLGIASYFFAKNIIILTISTIICLVSLGVLFGLLFTLIEAAFLSFLKSAIQKSDKTAEEIFSEAKEFLKPLFLFNIIISFVSSSVFLSVMMIPDLLNSFVFDKFTSSGNSIPQTVYFILTGLFAYFNAIFITLFIFTPFILAKNHSKRLSEALHENVQIVKNNFGSYLALILSGVLFIGIVSVLLEAYIPSTEISLSMIMLKESIHSLLFVFFILTFSIVAFRRVIDYQNRETK